MNKKQTIKYISGANRIAVVRTDRLGDMVLTLPMCLALKRSFPETEIILFASSYCEPLLANTYTVNKVIYADQDKEPLRKIFRREMIDIIFFPRPVFSEAMEAFRAGVKLRVGSGYRFYSFLFNRRIYEHRKKGKFHEAEYNVRIVEYLTGQKTCIELVKPYISPVALASVNNILENNNIVNNFPVVIVHPGSGGSAYKWKAENFGIIANILSANYKVHILITGTKDESEICGRAALECPSAVNLCGKLSLAEMIALISRSNMMIANSTGVLHIAAASGIKTVGLYPNTTHLSPVRWRPYSEDSICLTPEYGANDGNRDNMDLIKPEKVAEAAVKLLMTL